MAARPRKSPGGSAKHVTDPGRNGTKLRARARRFLEALAESGIVRVACRESGLSRATAYRLRDRSPKFRRCWRHALLDAREALEAEARRRGLEGYDRPVYQNGRKVGIVREYSDSLLTTLLKATNPRKFQSRHQVEVAPRREATPFGGVSPDWLKDPELRRLAAETDARMAQLRSEAQAAGLPSPQLAAGEPKHLDAVCL